MSYWLRRLQVSHKWMTIFVTVVSALVCILLLPTRIPGMELLGIGPNWLLIWVVAWCVKRDRTLVEGAIAGLVLGMIQDGMTNPEPTHTLSLVLVGVLTVSLRKLKLFPQELMQRDLITISLLVFGMAILSETVMALQFQLYGNRDINDIWLYHQQVALTSGIISSLWTSAIAFPLTRLG
ncbi:MAG: rod shape-determining protein MreD [Microcoleaceae cyanobacterium]|jgi:rod shape-determining protein MreD